MSELPFNHADIEAHFDTVDYERGRNYWRSGTVMNLEIAEDGYSLTARVRGTRLYKVEVNILPGRPLKSGGTSRPDIAAVCSCPVGMNCKHAVATCLEALDTRGQPHSIGTGAGHIAHNMPAAQGIDTIIASLPPHMRATIQRFPTPSKTPDPNEEWLDALATKAGGEPEKSGAAKRRIIYLIDVPDDRRYYIHHQARLQAFIAPVLKDGRFGRPQSASIHQMVDSGAKYRTPEDIVVGRLMRGGDDYSTDVRSPPLESDFFDVVLRHAIATGRCFLDTHESEPLSLGAERQAKLGWRIELEGVQIPGILAHDEQARLYILPAARPWYVDIATREAGPLVFDAPLALVHKFLEGPKLLPDAIAGVAQKMAARSFPGTIVPPRAIRIETRDPVPPIPCLRLVSHATGYDSAEDWDDIDRIHHIALLHFDYDGLVVDPRNAPDFLRRQTDDCIISRPRDRQAEAHFIQRLTANRGLAPAYVRPPDVPKSRLAYAFASRADERMRWLDFMHREVVELRAEGWRIDIDQDFTERFAAVEADEDAWEADLKEQKGGAWWFSLDLGIAVDGQRVALLPLLVQALKRLSSPSTVEIEKLALSGRLYVDLPDGRALALPFERVKDILTTLVELYDRPLNPDGTMNVPLDLASALSRIDEATKMRWLGGERLKALIERLKTFKGLVEILPPRGLVATLRPYQREGLNWLQFLRDYGLGGILADDMGLGKTVQTLAHILVEKQAGRLDRPCLIVCPTSLIPNWQDEAAKFAPELTVLSLHGKERAARFGEIDKADLVLTTYPLLLRDSDTLLPIEWYMVVLDEAQAIKNPAAQITQLACELKARHRLCLTGTPIENNLGEAWSHFAFLMPGMLGTNKDFNKRFRTPIEKQKDTGRQALLVRRLKPFILRRNKSDVARELPPKTEIIHHVEFDGPQRDLYETLRLAMHEKVQQAVSEKGFNRSRIIILDALLKLRQTCCDPRLLKLTGAKKVKHSAKLESLMEMLPSMIEEGRRVLLFSQFTSMLDLIKPELGKAEIPFVEIRGDTADRKTPVTQFQNGEVPLFLISLKAGGTGLNLTAADTVIHYDPWWNPAVENQATDRAHRIGQDKSVFVYKFIVKGTVEDRILDLQNRKRSLACALLEERPDAVAAFEADDLDFLFREAT
jgi:superfamily II DNA or RNA helicase